MFLKEKLRLSEDKMVPVDTQCFSPALYPKNTVPGFQLIWWLANNDFHIEFQFEYFCCHCLEHYVEEDLEEG